MKAKVNDIISGEIAKMKADAEKRDVTTSDDQAFNHVILKYLFGVADI